MHTLVLQTVLDICQNTANHIPKDVPVWMMTKRGCKKVKRKKK